MEIASIEYNEKNGYVAYKDRFNYLHNKFGPAQIWYDGYKLYCIHGEEILFITANGCWRWIFELNEIEKEKYIHQFGCAPLMVGSELERE